MYSTRSNTRGKTYSGEDQIKMASGGGEVERAEVEETIGDLNDRLIKQGKQLGLKGTELMAFVKEEKQVEREMREREAHRRAEEKEADRQIARENTARLAEKELREYELERLRIESGIPNSNNNAEPQTRLRDNFKPRIPFLEDKDNVETWFKQFELFAAEYELSAEQKARRIFFFLKGKSRELYDRMSEEDKSDYDEVKATILKGFNLTAEDYRIKFRTSRRQGNESHKEIVHRLATYFDKWTKLSGIEEAPEEIMFLMMSEQIYNVLPHDLVVYLKDRQPEDLKSLIQIIEHYETSRKNSKPDQNDQTKKNRPSHGKGKTDKPSAPRFKKEEEGKENKVIQGNTRPGYRRCFVCHRVGHTARFCKQKSPEKKDAVGCVRERPTETQPVYLLSCPHNEDQAAVVHTRDRDVGGRKLNKLCTTCQAKPFQSIVLTRINGQETNAMRDTGCTGVVVSADLVRQDQYNGKMMVTTLASTEVTTQLPVAVVEIDSPYFMGMTEVIVMQNPLYPILIGQTYGTEEEKKVTPLFPVREPEWYPDRVATVTTRKQKSEEEREKETKGQFQETKGTRDSFTHFEPGDLKREQASDPSLKRIRQFAEKNEVVKGVSYQYKNGILLRIISDLSGTQHSKIVVPKKMREKVLVTGHDSPMAGHMGIVKTTNRIKEEFWWPGMPADIKRYVASCDVCQRTSPKGRTPTVPLGKQSTIDVMFKKVAVDIIGPIEPMSESKKRYILVMIDYNTRYPEAVALKDIHASTVATALWEMWTRLGIPDTIVTDQGKQFTSKLMREVNELLRIQHNTTAPFHPQANGLVEKFNGTLKNMIKKLALEEPKKWDTILPAILFAYREVPQSSLGFSPFEMLYGHKVKGPLQILRETWTQETPDSQVKTCSQYVIDLRNRLEQTCRIARENLKGAQKRQAKYYNQKTKTRTFQPGQRVLLLLPNKQNKLELTWRGPYKVSEKLNEVDYRIQVGNKSKVFHINLMKEYVERDAISTLLEKPVENTDDDMEVIDGMNVHCAIVIAEETTPESLGEENGILLPSIRRTEDKKDVIIAQTLNSVQKSQIQELCAEFDEYLTDVPKQTNLIKCEIKVENNTPVFIRPRPVPHALVESVEEEVEEMLRLGVIEPAKSPYNSPIVMVKKKDGTHRFCADLRGLNRVVVFDGEPTTDVDHLFQNLGKAKYFTKLDLTKGYWAIPIEEEDRDKTAFTTSKGQFRWVNMPFGLKTAAGVFNRMMRKFLGPIKTSDVHHYMDDVLVATETWDQHLKALRAVFKRLKEANLAAKPSKCFVGFSEISFLGHEVGHGTKVPDSGNVEKIRQATLPKNKRELRSFLGLCGFYRGYIQDYSKIAAPLTDLTKKQHPDKVIWNHEAQDSFETLKDKICQRPILKIPDLTEPFVLRTDASDAALGAVLLQEEEGVLKPVAYQSKKLSETEKRYSTVEKECYATVWGIKNFERFLYGKHFILETDHQPLRNLQLNPTNSRLMRWALQLQPYSFTVRYIPGKENHGADYLSRMSSTH